MTILTFPGDHLENIDAGAGTAAPNKKLDQKQHENGK